MPVLTDFIRHYRERRAVDHRLVVFERNDEPKCLFLQQGVRMRHIVRPHLDRKRHQRAAIVQGIVGLICKTEVVSTIQVNWPIGGAVERQHTTIVDLEPDLVVREECADRDL